MGLLSYITQDFNRKNLLHLYYSNKGHEAVIRFRFCQYLWNHGYKKLALLATNRNIVRTGCDIAPDTQIGAGLKIGHPVGIVIGAKARIGEHVMIQGGVTIGTKDHRKWDGNVVIGDYVEIGTGAKLLGDITVGDYAQIGANAVVLSDVPEKAVAVGVPARVVGTARGSGNT